MKYLNGFICKSGLHATYIYGKNTKIEGETTTMIPMIDPTTVEDLLNTLKKEKTKNKSYISIYQNLENSKFDEISKTNELKQYFSSKITGILCIENNEGTYYDVVIDSENFKFQPIS